eukprot:jgi/Tetstr1/431140/TSEL_020854.t1
MDLALTIFFAVSMGAVLVVAVALVVIMPNAHTDWLVKLDACTAWVTALSTLVLVPIDVAGAIHTGWYKAHHDQMLEVLWAVFFWNGLLMQITLLPFHQECADSGGLTLMDRVTYSLTKNLLLYMVLLVGGGTAAGLTILSGQQIQWHWWISLLAATGNAIGLFLGLLLMSYGMVEIPKRLWYLSNLHAIHQSMYHRVGVNHANALEAKRELLKCQRMAANANRLFRRTDPLKRHVEGIEAMARHALPPPDPLDLGEAEVELSEDADVDYDFLSRGELAGLKRKVRSAIEEWERCVARYTEAAHRYVELEDVLHNSDREGMRFQSSAPRRGDEVTGLAASLAGHGEWWWRCRIKPLLFRAGALLTGLLSLGIVVAEATISPLLPNLSIFSQLMQNDAGLLQTMLVCMFSLAYPVICAYFSLFRLGQTQYFMLVPRHTSPHSLLMHATLMCRFAAPLAFNFMIAIALPYSTDPDMSDHTDTVFYHTIGVKMIRLPVIGFELTTYLPTMMGILMLLMMLDIPNRLALLLMPHRRMRVIASDEWTGDEPPGPAREARKLLAVERENYKMLGKAGLGRGTLIHERHFPGGSRGVGNGRAGDSLRSPLLAPTAWAAAAETASPSVLGARARTPASSAERPPPQARQPEDNPPLLQANIPPGLRASSPAVRPAGSWDPEANNGRSEPAQAQSRPHTSIPRRWSGELQRQSQAGSSAASQGALSTSLGASPSMSLWFQEAPSGGGVGDLAGMGAQPGRRQPPSLARPEAPSPAPAPMSPGSPLNDIVSKIKQKKRSNADLKSVISFPPKL